MMDKDTEGKVFMKGSAFNDILTALVDTDCGRDCRVRMDVTGNEIELEIRGCDGHTPCFIEMLQAMGSMH